MNHGLSADKKEEFGQFIGNLWQNSPPLMKLFRTETKGYLYDTGTNRIFACEEAEFEMLDDLTRMGIRQTLDKAETSFSPSEFKRAIQNIRAVIDSANVLKTKKATGFGLSSHYTKLEEGVRTSLGMVQLELTEKCNLRCAYCIYNPYFKEKRNHGSKDMPQRIALGAIDYLSKNSINKEDVAVTFYGGEPLIRLASLKTCVAYARSLLKRKNLRFSITTNATLIDPSIANFLAKEKFGVHVSLDGPPDIHDQYRRDVDGHGSFKRTASGLRTLYSAFAHQKQDISLSMVYSPPYSKERINRISELWEDLPWLPKDIALNITYAHGFMADPARERHQGQLDFSLLEWARDRFVKDYRAGIAGHPIARNFIEQALVNIVKRSITDAPLGKYHLNGCCIPAVRKLFISVNGDFAVCERIGKAPSIGDLYSGIDLDRIKRIYVKDYGEKSLPFCSECWALQLCNICYTHAFSDGRINSGIKNEYCAGQKQVNLEFLKLYCALLEIKESGLDYLMKRQIN